MIWSVSTLSRSSTATIPVCVLKLCIILVLVLPATDVDKMTRHGGCCRHGGAHQVGATARTPATFKIAIAGGSAALTGLQPVSIHTQAHGTTRLAPLEAGIGKDSVQPFLFRRGLHLLRAWHYHSVNAIGDLVALDHSRRGADIFQARVGA